MKRIHNLLRKINTWIENRKNTESVSSELSSNFLEKKKDLGSYLIVSDKSPIIEWHTLKTDIDGKLLYDHLEWFREDVITHHSSNTVLIDVMPILIEEIKKINVNLMWLKNPNTTEGDGEWESHEDAWSWQVIKSNSLLYFRNDWYKQALDIGYIFEIMEWCGLDVEDQVKLFVVIAWLPKWWIIDEHDQCEELGEKWRFVISPNDLGSVKCIEFTNDWTWFSRIVQWYALPMFTTR